MMKKLLSIILTVCMLLSLVIVPVSVQATENEDTYEPTLGGYYKFTFDEGEVYNYQVATKTGTEGAAEHKKGTFYPLWNNSGSAAGTTIGRKDLKLSDGGSVSVLEISSIADTHFTPVDIDGNPFEMKPGVTYTINLEMFVPREDAWNQAYLRLGSNDRKADSSNYIKVGGTSYDTLKTYNGKGLSSVGGEGYAINYANGSYDKDTTFGYCKCKLADGGLCLNKYGHWSFNNKLFVQKQLTYTVPTENFAKDDNDLYTGTFQVYDISGSEIVGETRSYNNYLSFYFGGGNVNSCEGNKDLGCGYYASGNAERKNVVANTFQIVSIEIFEENFVNTPSLTLHNVYNKNNGQHENIKVLDDAGTYKLYIPDAPEGKYFMGWYTKKNGGEAITTSSFTVEDANDSATIAAKNLYARYGDYVDNKTYTFDNYAQTGAPAINGIAYMNGEENYSVEIREKGVMSAGRRYTDEGIVFSRKKSSWSLGVFGYQESISAANTTGKAVQLTENIEKEKLVLHPGATPAEGETNVVGWGVGYDSFVVRDEKGVAAVPKANTTYTAVITYKLIGEGQITFGLLSGRKLSGITKDVASASESSSKSDTRKCNNEIRTGEFDTVTFSFTTGTFEDEVPVFSLYAFPERFVGEYTGDTVTLDQTYGVYKLVDIPEVAIKEIQIIEVQPNNTAVTYKSYEEGVGFSAVVKDNAPGEPLDVSTKNVDTNWYTSTTPINKSNIVKDYPENNTVLYNADYYMAKVNEIDNSNIGLYFGDGSVGNDIIEFKPEVVDGKYALKYSSDVKVTTGDNQVLRLRELEDGHTYKFTASFKADVMNTDMSFNLATAQYANRQFAGNQQGTFTVEKDRVTAGDWTTVTYYFTADPIGSRQDAEETGYDYSLDSQCTLFLDFVQDAAGQNTVYLADVKVEDLGEVITTGAASILTEDELENAGNKQAIRYFFNYATTDGSDIAFGGETFTVVERGFIYRNGELKEVHDMEKPDFFASYNGRDDMVKMSKSDNFNECWDYVGDVMTFSTYVKGFNLSDERKLQVKAYLLVEDTKGNRFYIHSDSINRSVNGVKGLLENPDADFFVGS